MSVPQHALNEQIAKILEEMMWLCGAGKVAFTDIDAQGRFLALKEAVTDLSIDVRDAETKETPDARYTD